METQIREGILKNNNYPFLRNKNIVSSDLHPITNITKKWKSGRYV